MGYMIYGHKESEGSKEATRILEEHYRTLEEEAEYYNSKKYITDTVICQDCGENQELTWLDGEDLVCQLCSGRCEQ